MIAASSASPITGKEAAMRIVDFGLVHAHLGCCIDNTDYYENFYTSADGNRVQGESWGLLNAPVIVDGHLAPPDGPGWGAVWDETRFRQLIVAEH
jgi:hypothetical protein